MKTPSPPPAVLGPPTVSAARDLRLISLVLPVFAVLVCLPHVQQRLLQTVVDFQQFWAISRTVLPTEEVAQVYSPKGRATLAENTVKRLQQSDAMGIREQGSAAGNVQIAGGDINKVYHPTATPLLYGSFLCYSRLMSHQFELASVVYLFLLQGCGLLALVLAAKKLQWGLPLSLLLLPLLGVLPECVLSDIRVGNVNQLQLLGLTLVCLCLMQPGIAPLCCGALLMGWLVAFKPSVATAGPALILFYVAEKRYRAAGWFAGVSLSGIGLGVVMGSLWTGSLSVWQEWFQVMRELAAPIRAVNEGNYALPQILFEAKLAGPGVGKLLAVAFAVLILAVAFVRFRSPPRDDQALAKVIFPVVFGSVGVTLCVSNLAWLHYYVLLLPLAWHALSKFRNWPQAQLGGQLMYAGLLVTGIFGPNVAPFVVASPLAIASICTLPWLALVCLALLEWGGWDPLTQVSRA